MQGMLTRIQAQRIDWSASPRRDELSHARQGRQVANEGARGSGDPRRRFCLGFSATHHMDVVTQVHLLTCRRNGSTTVLQGSLLRIGFDER